jgi:hypothetical protein
MILAAPAKQVRSRLCTEANLLQQCGLLSKLLLPNSVLLLAQT